MGHTHLLDALGNPLQTEPDGPARVLNEAGGYVFAVSDRTRLERFLILGSEGGTYYASERMLTKENLEGVKREIARDGRGVVDLVVDVSEGNRAPKNDPALLVLAMAAKLGDADTRKRAFAALPKVARILTHLYHFAAFVDNLGGWGRGTRRAIGRWFTDRSIASLARQLVKYQSRDGWSSRDLLRLAHPRPEGNDRDTLFKWATGNPDVALGVASGDIDPVRAFEALKVAPNAGVVAELVRHFKMPREAVPTQWLKDPDVWAALLDDMPPHALLRNLGNLGKSGLLVPGSVAKEQVLALLADTPALGAARVHPIAVLTAFLTYKSGHSVKGDGQWPVVQSVVDALDAAFYSSFGTVEPSGGRVFMGLDVSGSMDSGTVAGVPGLTPRDASVAMAMITAKVEKQAIIAGFSRGLTMLDISPRRRLDDNVRTVRDLPFESTDCALPIVFAGSRGIEVDTFVVYTDSETYSGNVHPFRALKAYRAAFNPAAKLVVVGMTSNGFTIADPSDSGMLDVVGFDASAPQAIAEFSKGRMSGLDKKPERL